MSMIFRKTVNKFVTSIFFIICNGQSRFLSTLVVWGVEHKLSPMHTNLVNCINRIPCFISNYVMYIYFQHLTFLQKASTATLQEIFQMKITAECFIVVIVSGETHFVTFITPVLPTVLFITQRIRHVEALVQVWYVTILLFLIEETVCVQTLMGSLCKIW